jgi:hypothetical protein
MFFVPHNPYFVDSRYQPNAYYARNLAKEQALRAQHAAARREREARELRARMDPPSTYSPYPYDEDDDEPYVFSRRSQASDVAGAQARCRRDQETYMRKNTEEGWQSQKVSCRIGYDTFKD